MRTVYRDKNYYCGDYLDVYIFPAYKKANTRSSRAKPTSEVQQKLNKRHAEEKLIRLLHTNFTPEDISLGLSYRYNPESEEQAKRNIQNFLRRVRRLRSKSGLSELKYITVTEKSSKGRYHHHVVINGGLDRDVIESLWGFGTANSKRLQFDENGLEGLSRYIVKSPIFSKRWNSSKNLIDPEPDINNGKISAKKARLLAKESESRALFEELYPDYALSIVEPFYNDSPKEGEDIEDKHRGVYLFARLYRKDGRFLSAKRKAAKEKSNGKRE